MALFSDTPFNKNWNNVTVGFLGYGYAEETVLPKPQFSSPDSFQVLSLLLLITQFPMKLIATNGSLNYCAVFGYFDAPF